MYRGILADASELKKLIGLKGRYEIVKEYGKLFEELWNPITDVRKEYVPTIAIDGSVNRRKLHVGTIFAVRAVAIRSEPRVRSDTFKVKEKLDILKYPFHYRERTILYMEGLEAELFADVAMEPPYIMLMDGMFSVACNCHRVLRDYGCEPFHGTLSDLLSIDVGETEDAHRVRIRLECGWKMEKYKEVAKLSSKVKTVYVAKSYSSNEIFKHKELYDIEIIDLLAKTPGFTMPYIEEIEVGCKEKIKVPITKSYMKFSKGGSVYFVEMLGKWSMEEVKELFYYLERYSVRGYPLPLTLAHRKADIPDKLMDMLVKKLGSGTLKSGREAL